MGGHIWEEKALQLKDKYGLEAFVETGTWKGETTAWAAGHFDQVWTVEGVWDRYKAAMQMFIASENVIPCYGDSRWMLWGILMHIDQPGLLWLDAHWMGDSVAAFKSGDECPIEDELKAVRRNGHKHIIMIDDARYFTGRPDRPHNPALWPTYEQIAGWLPHYSMEIEKDIIIAEPI